LWVVEVGEENPPVKGLLTMVQKASYNAYFTELDM